MDNLYNLEVEQSLLGLLLINNRTYDRVCEFLLPDHFYDGRHAEIYRVISELINKGKTADPLTLEGYFRQNEFLDDVGGPKYLRHLSNLSVTSRGAEDYGRLIHDFALRRELKNILHNNLALLEKNSENKEGKSILENIEQSLYQLSTDSIHGDFIPFGTSLQGALEEYETAYKADGQVVGIPTGLIDVDRMLGGFRKSDLIILASRPGMGKTALAGNIMLIAAKQGFSIGFFSLEMTDNQLAGRVLTMLAGIEPERARRGELNADEFNKLIHTKREINSLPIFIDPTASQTVPIMRSRARRLKRKQNLDMIIVDYIGLAEATKRHYSKVHEIEEITKGLKAIAKEFNIPVLALSQLSRALESRENKRPVLSDLRDSGAIEQDADQVLFLYRDEYYAQNELNPPRRSSEYSDDGKGENKYEKRKLAAFQRWENSKNQAELIISKNRHGKTGVIPLFFEIDYLKFGNLQQKSKENQNGTE